MPEKGKRWKKRVHYKAPSGKSRQRYKEKKGKLLVCKGCGNRLHGVPHALKKHKLGKLSKTQKRPSALFGGLLCSSCRSDVMQEAVLCMDGQKSLNQTGLREKKWVEMAIQSIKR